MAGRVAGSKTDRLASIPISEHDLKFQHTAVLVERLVAGGVSRLTAERYVEIERGSVGAGRARAHSMSRR